MYSCIRTDCQVESNAIKLTLVDDARAGFTWTDIQVVNSVQLFDGWETDKEIVQSPEPFEQQPIHMLRELESNASNHRREHTHLYAFRSKPCIGWWGRAHWKLAQQGQEWRRRARDITPSWNPVQLENSTKLGGQYKKTKLVCVRNLWQLVIFLGSASPSWTCAAPVQFSSRRFRFGHFVILQVPIREIYDPFWVNVKPFAGRVDCSMLTVLQSHNGRITADNLLAIGTWIVKDNVFLVDSSAEYHQDSC